MKMHLIEPNTCTQTAPTVLLIHPMLSSAEGIKTVLVNNMGDELRYLVPDLAAHGEEDATEYISVSQETAQIHDWLLEHSITHLSLGFGASLGGVVLSELLKFTDLSFDHLFFEGTSFWTGGFLASTLEFVLKKVFLAKHRKAIANPELSVQKMERLYGKIAAKPMSEHFITMSNQSIQNIIHDCSNVDLPALSPDVQRRCIFAYGEKDFDLKRAKQVLPKVYPEATLTIWQGYDHCERMTSDSAAYGQMLRELVVQRLLSEFSSISKSIDKERIYMLESDKPITSTHEDKLNMSKPSNSLAHVLADQKDSDSLVVGIYGEWGSGKSSFVNLLKQELIELSNNHPEYKQPVMITFDPWLCTSDNAMLHRFFKELATFLDTETNLKDIAKNIIKYAKIVAPLVPLPGFPDSLECASAALEDSEITTEDLKNEIEESLKTCQKKFYIFIDDLDRLPDDQIRLIFQLVNHLADFSNITYVISFDHDVVTTALNKIQSGKGAEYLKKIIQLPYSIPRPGQELVIEILLEKLSIYIEKVPDKNFSHYRFFNIQNSFIRTYIHTLRDVKLLINTFTTNIIKLSDELDLMDLLALSFLKAFNQSLYKWIYENKDILCKYELNQQGDKYIANLSKSLLTSGVCTEQTLQNTIALLSELFPKVARKGPSSSNNEDRRLRRISCDDNFNQYFSGDFPLTFVSRDDLNKILYANDSSITHKIINEAIANERLTNLLNEIKYNLEFFNRESLIILAEQLIYTLGKSSEYINKSFFGMSADTLMSFILSDVLKKIGKDESGLIVKKSLSHVDLDNVLSFAYWLNHEELVYGRLASNEKSEDKQSINLATLTEIEQIYAKKIEEMISNTDLLSIHFDLHLPMYLWSCYSFERYKDFWIKKFNDDDLNYIVFIDSISNELTSSSYKKWSWNPADFNKLISYEKIKSHILKLKKSEKLKDISKELICKAITFVEKEPNEESNLNDEMDSEFTNVQTEKKLSEWIK